MLSSGGLQKLYQILEAIRENWRKLAVPSWNETGARGVLAISKQREHSLLRCQAMKQVIHISLLCLLVLLCSASAAFAKGPAEKISISGPGLTAPIEITDPELLQPFSPWSDAFFDQQRGLVTESPDSGRAYQVLIFADSRVFYAFNYIPGNPGMIYLPGRGEEWYETNVSTILRSGGLEGHWLYASREWDDLIGSLLADQGISEISYTETSARTGRMETISPFVPLSSQTRTKYIPF